MKTESWENERLYIINRDIDKMIEDKIVKTVVSLSITATPNLNGPSPNYTTILIYK